MKLKMPIEEYHSYKNVVSSSGLRYLAKAPIYYQAYLRGIFSEEKTHFVEGQAFHTLVLEPDLFSQTYVVCPQVNLTTKAGKEEFAKIKEENPGKIILRQKEYDEVAYMAEAVRKHSLAQRLLSEKAEVEMSFFWEEELEYDVDQTEFSRCPHCETANLNPEAADFVSGPTITVACISCGKEYRRNTVMCRTRPDFLTKTFVVDLKTTKDVTPHSFRRSIFDYGYHQQAALQLAGVEKEGYSPTNYYWIAVEKGPPNAVAVYQASKDTLTSGRLEYRALLNTLRWCLDTDMWYGYQEIIEV